MKGIVCRAYGFVLLLGGAASLGSCAQRHSLSREELRSDLTSAISAASETELSIDFVLRGKTTQDFAAGHFRYLERNLRDTIKQVAGSTPEPGLEEKATRSRAQMDALESMLTAIASDTKDPDALMAAKQRVHAIRIALAQEKPGQ
ncbi:MAG TPA: hypothetical protein VF126_13665 [Acidobacteriaceae bacterium]